MKNISTAEFQKQYKQYMDALYATKRSEKGGGYAGVELQASNFEASPSIADKTSAQKVSVPEAEVSVPGAAAEEPECVSVPWSGDVNDLFEQMDLGGAVYNGDSEVETGLAATLLPGRDLLACGDGQALIASALVAEPIRQQPAEGFTAMPALVNDDDDIDQWFEQFDLSEVKYQGEPEVEVALIASMSNTIATVRKYQPIEPSQEGIGKQSAEVARKNRNSMVCTQSTVTLRMAIQQTV
jgi:hypothetical protein